MKRFALYAVMLLTLLLGGQFPPHNNIPTPQQELADLTRRGYTYRYLDNNLIELTEPATGTKRVKSLATTDEATIRAWAQQRGVPIIEIDPAQIDTNLYAGWHQYWTEVPLGNLWEPLQLGDLNGNGLVDVYGTYKDFQGQNESRIYEIDAIGQGTIAFKSPQYRSIALDLVDTDGDSLFEVFHNTSALYLDYEQPVSDFLPTELNFEHSKLRDNTSAGYSRMAIQSMDNDALIDLVYKGSEYDSAFGSSIGKAIVAEYDPDSNNFVRKWVSNFQPSTGVGVGIGGFSVGDFDGDALREFVCSDLITGIVYLVENTGDNLYEQTWQDSTPFVNLYYHSSADLDGDGLDEFFICATMSDGNWVVIYEADGNDTYSARAILHILDGGTFDEPVLLRSDIDGDGRPEMFIPSGSGLYVIKWNGSDYYLWYYKYMPGQESAQVYRFFSDSKQSLVIGRRQIDSFGRARFYSNVYRPGPALSVTEQPAPRTEFWIRQNYPNPFNPVTSFSYAVGSLERVSLKVYNILGAEVAVVFDKVQPPGVYSAKWEAHGIPSGVYFYSFRAGSFAQAGKMILVR